jgi:sugar phosphate isomerase/epimerase
VEAQVLRDSKNSRRGLLLAGAAAATASLACTSGGPTPEFSGRIRQSLAYWCLNATEWAWDIDRICQFARDHNCESVELVPYELWPKLAEYGLRSALGPNGVPDPPFVRGLNNPLYRDEVVGHTKTAIDRCSDFGVPNVIAFTGYKWRDADDPTSGEISPEEGAGHCVAALKELAPQAEEKNVTICLEQLNTRDATHPMKGHPGYQGDDIDYCADIVRRVGSPNVKLLFDIYHVQVMHGDVIRRLGENQDLLGHVHVAGNPGRGDLNDRQEIAYPAVMHALLDLGYDGFVGQEFIPVRDPDESLVDAIRVCDV